jgi:PE family
MSYLIAAPEMMAAAARDLTGIGSALGETHMAAAPPTAGLVPAAADEVSTGVAQLFSQYAKDYHALAGRAGDVVVQL